MRLCNKNEMFDGSQQAPTGVTCWTMTGLLTVQALNSCFKAMDDNQDPEHCVSKTGKSIRAAYATLSFAAQLTTPWQPILADLKCLFEHSQICCYSRLEASLRTW